MPSKHTLLSPSSSHRWLNCTPSPRLEEQFPNNDTTAAAEGTAAHALCEHKLKKALKMRSNRPVSEYDSDEMELCSDGYVEYVLEKLTEAKKLCSDPLVLIEQHLDFSKYVTDGFGTGDCLIIADDTIHIIDFKYGQGVVVDATDNPQMKLYALGALEMYAGIYDIKQIALTIYQPRRNHISEWEISVDDLLEWAYTELKVKAELAYNGEGDYCAGEWCTFCRAAVKCRARAEAKLQLAQYEFAQPPLLSDEEIEDILGKLDDLTAWAKDIKEYAEDAAINHGKKWTGFKVVEGRSVRKYTDEDAVAEAAKLHGYKDIFKQSLITITEMEKLLGKREFNEILGDLVYKPPGKPMLVPESDKRPAINTTTATDEFSNMED